MKDSTRPQPEANPPDCSRFNLEVQQVLADDRQSKAPIAAKSGFNPVLAAQPRTIFDVMSTLARELNAVNLGQGFPDEDGAPDVREFAARSLIADSNQYPPSPGLLELRQAVADHYRRFQGLDLDGPGEVVVTSGATEALAAAILGLISPGDEVVMFQP